jgi:hypothetical protein
LEKRSGTFSLIQNDVVCFIVYQRLAKKIPDTFFPIANKYIKYKVNPQGMSRAILLFSRTYKKHRQSSGRLFIKKRPLGGCAG